MSDVVNITDLSEFRLKQLENEIISRLSHPDPTVLSIWKEMACEAIRRFPGAPAPSQSQVSLSMPSTATDDERAALQKQFISFFSSYKKDVMDQLLELLRDHIMLQKEVAEYRANER